MPRSHVVPVFRVTVGRPSIPKHSRAAAALTVQNLPVKAQRRVCAFIFADHLEIPMQMARTRTEIDRHQAGMSTLWACMWP
jgi:hypothetical protein